MIILVRITRAKNGKSIGDIGNLIFTLNDQYFDHWKLRDFHIQNYTFSLYYHHTHLNEGPMYAIIAPINANYESLLEHSSKD
jgi:hypothetical protein